MRPMSPRRLRTLITGLALFIIGPAVGFCAYIGIALYALPHAAVRSPAEALAQLQQLPSQLLLAVIPLALGLLCGAAGLFLVICTLAVHLLGYDSRKTATSEPQSNHASRVQIRTPASTVQKPAPAAGDSRYMPKFQ
jgi:hypothetical protein